MEGMWKVYFRVKLSFLLLALVGSNVLADEKSNSLRWAPDLVAARVASAKFKVPLMVHFHGDNCLPCRTFEQRVLSQSDVIGTLNKYFICVAINASQQPEIATEFGVHSWPTDVFLAADNESLFQTVCPQDAREYMGILTNVALMNHERNTMLASQLKSQPSQDSAQSTTVNSPMLTNVPPENSKNLASGFGGQVALPPSDTTLQPIAPQTQIANAPTQGNPSLPAPAGTHESGSQLDSKNGIVFGKQRIGAPELNQGPSGSGPQMAATFPHQNVFASQAPRPANSVGPYSMLRSQPNFPPERQTVQMQPTQQQLPSHPNTAQMVTGPAATRAGVNSPNPYSNSAYGGLAQSQLPPMPPIQNGLANDQRVASTPMAANVPTSVAVPSPYGASQATGPIHSQLPPMPSMKFDPASDSRIAAAPTVASTPNPVAVQSPQVNPPMPKEIVVKPNDQTVAGQLVAGPQSPAEGQFKLVSSAKASPVPEAANQANAINPEQLAPSGAPVLDGFCPVSLHAQQWVAGNAEHAVRHRGKVYWMSSQEAADSFLKSPDDFAPVFSGCDPNILLNEGRLVPGSTQFVLLESTTNQILLFSSQESKSAFQRDEANFNKNMQALEAVRKRAMAQ